MVRQKLPLTRAKAPKKTQKSQTLIDCFQSVGLFQEMLDFLINVRLCIQPENFAECERKLNAFTWSQEGENTETKAPKTKINPVILDFLQNLGLFQKLLDFSKKSNIHLKSPTFFEKVQHFEKNQALFHFFRDFCCFCFSLWQFSIPKCIFIFSLLKSPTFF